MKILKKSLVASMFLGSVLCTPVIANASTPVLPQGMATLAPMIAKIRPAVVNIFVEGKTQQSNVQIPDEFKFFFGPDLFGDQQPRTFNALGSGVIIDANKGLVITNHHVIEGADKITIQLFNGQEFSASLVGSDQLSDVALLKIKDPKNLTSIQFADSDKLQVGDFAVAIGNPFGLGQTTTFGIISALARSTDPQGGGYQNFIQTDAAVNRGNSGGPLINLNGQLIGINTQIVSPSGGNAGIAFAIPSNMVKNIAEQLAQNGKISRGVLGIKGRDLTSDLAKALGIDLTQGAFINEVVEGTAASKAGIKAGDVITALNGTPIRNFNQLRAKIATHNIKVPVSITYVRNNKTITVKVMLTTETQTQNPQTNVIPTLKGVVYQNYKNMGVKIISIEKGSIAQQRGLKEGDIITGVNRVKITNIEQLQKAIKDSDGLVALNILRDKNNFFLILK